MEEENKPSAGQTEEPAAAKQEGETGKKPFFSTGAGKAVLVGGGAVIVALIAVIVVLLTRPAPEEAPARRDVLISAENAEEAVQEMLDHEPVPVGYYEVNMNSTWYYPNGSTSPSSNAYVENVQDNTNDVYFDVEIEGTGEVIYESPVIPLGMYIQDFPLDKELDPGTYDCTLIYHLIDEEQNSLSTLRMAVTIVVS